MPGYEYNPLLKLDLQKKSAVSPSDIQHLEQEIASINEDITDINGDLKNKVPKIKVSISEIDVDEIGQKQDGSTADMTEGFFYKRGEGVPVEYEDVTIPVGSKKIIYTNKFDQSQQYVYAFNTIPLQPSALINYQQQGSVFLLDDTFHSNIINNASAYWILDYPSIIPTNESGLVYCQHTFIVNLLINAFVDSGHGTIDELRECYKYINDVFLYSGFRLTLNSVATIGRVSDILLNIAIPIKKGETEGYSYRTCLASDFLAVNWVLTDYISQIYPLTPSSEVFAYDDARPCYFYATFVYVVIKTENGSKYVLQKNGESGQRADYLYQTVAEDGEATKFIDISHLNCVFDSTPVSTSTVWASALDADLFFNYDAEIVDISESITIHRRIPHYDENGFLVVDKPAIVRVDVQPPTDPSQFATAGQGEKADTALQSIRVGTDGDYITTTIGTKDANNEQSVSVSLTLQPIATAGSGAKGVAEASDVKDYIGNNTATPSQGAKADSALQQIVHGTDGSYITTTVTQKDANNEQTIYAALTLQDIETADADHKGVAEASNVRNFFNVIAAESEAYGVMWDTSNPSPNLTRIGNMRNHALLPVQSAMIGGVLADDGTFTPFDNQSDWTQATQARDGSDGQVMVRLPQHWRRCEKSGTYNIVMISPIAIPGYVEVRQQYVSAYEATLQHSTSKLCSVNNADADYRGGQNDASLDGTYRTLLNRPITNYNLAEFRTFARNRANNTKWNCLTYEAVRTIYWLFVTEYATLNSQADFNSALDANGFRQGGLGIGVSDWSGDAWNAYNGYAPLIPCGILDEYGSGTAVKQFSVYNADTTLAHTFSCNKYRGIEMPFAHIWKYVDGVFVNVESGDGVSTVYATTDTSYFSSTSFANYAEICNSYRVDSYIKDIVFNKEGDIFAISPNGNSTSYYCDQYWGANLPSSTELRAWRFGGPASFGARCGLACSDSNYGVGSRARTLGSRLCFVP